VFGRNIYIGFSPNYQILETFAKLRKAAISFIMYVCSTVRLSVRMEQLDSPCAYFREIWYLGIFR